MLKKIYLGTTIVFLSLVFSFSFLAYRINAQVPGFKFPPCDDGGISDPEFQSDRPYQTAPCGDSPKAFFCNNDYIIEEEVSTPFSEGNCSKSGGQYVCPTDKTISKDYVIDGENAEFPILGNTEDVANSQNGSSDSIDDATKVNEYVAWYLNGVVNKAEYGDTKNTDDQIINFSGPLQKLLPGAVLDFQRITSIKQATEEIPYVDTESVQNPDETPETVTEPGSHNQIVVCADTYGKISFQGQRANVQECYDGDGSGAKGEEQYRLKDWSEGDLSFVRRITNTILDTLRNNPVIGGIIGTIIVQNIPDAWNERTPPLPWQEGENGQPLFKNYLEYEKAYNEWRGKSCVIIPILNRLICVDGPIRNDFAELYAYVPLANTSDKNAKHWITGVGVRAPGETEAEMKSYVVERDPVLFYPHTQEVYDLTNILNITTSPKKIETAGVGTSSDVVDYENNNCKIVDVRSNPGDQLFPSAKNSRSLDATVSVNIHVSQIACPAGPIDRWLAERESGSCNPNCRPNDDTCVKCDRPPNCEATLSVEIRSGPKIPYADEIWKSTVVGQESAFRRIFPKVEEGAPVSCIADIPGVSTITYTPDSKTNLVRVETPKQNFKADGDTVNSELYFPHLGTVYEYFLKGIQTALRPKGYGETIVNGQFCTTECGQLPKGLLKPPSSCTLGAISPKIGNIPKSLKSIIEHAASTYNTPPELILGIMYGEGLFNPGRFNWSDQNVANWSTCSPIPGCNPTGDDNFMGFNGNDWEVISPNIEDDLLALDPNRQKPSQCNLLDTIYGVAWNLHDSADGGGGMDFQCFGLDLNASVPSSCSWNANQYISAIKIAENGYDRGCFTLPGSCAAGGGNAALCDNGIDGCEKFSTAGNTSHTACIWDVAHGD